jgi:hypothetical protein
VSSLGPSASALGLFLAPGCPCGKKALVATQHNAPSEKKQRGDEFASAAGAFRFATAHCRAADAERREA